MIPFDLIVHPTSDYSNILCHRSKAGKKVRCRFLSLALSASSVPSLCLTPFLYLYFSFRFSSSFSPCLSPLRHGPFTSTPWQHWAHQIGYVVLYLTSPRTTWSIRARRGSVTTACCDKKLHHVPSRFTYLFPVMHINNKIIEVNKNNGSKPMTLISLLHLLALVLVSVFSNSSIIICFPSLTKD